MKKFAYQRFEPSGFTKNPDIRNATSITDYVFRWLGCQFIKGYKEATSPNRGQTELPMKEIPEMEKKAVNRPVSDLPRTAREGIDRRDHEPYAERRHSSRGEQRPHATPNGCRKRSGNMFMDITCSALRQRQSDPRRRLRCLHRMRHEPGLQLNRRFRQRSSTSGPDRSSSD